MANDKNILTNLSSCFGDDHYLFNCLFKGKCYCCAIAPLTPTYTPCEGRRLCPPYSWRFYLLN